MEIYLEGNQMKGVKQAVSVWRGGISSVLQGSETASIRSMIYMNNTPEGIDSYTSSLADAKVIKKITESYRK